MKFLFETAFITEPQKFSQQAIYTILSNTKSLDFDIFSLLKEYKKSIPKEFPEEIIKLFECCVNEAELKKNETELSIQLSKKRGDISESEELKAVILDLVAIEKDIVDKKQVDDEGNHWSEVMVEILISLMTKESKTLRKAVVDSFRFIVSDLSMKSIEILADTISGQNNDGFGLSVNEEVETDSEDDSEEDEEEDEAVGDDESSDEEENEEIDASFHNSLSAIVNADGNESEEAGSEMDEQMMQLDEKLSKVFRERKRHLGKRQKQELEAQAMNFRLRNLDFIEVLACSRTAGMGLNYGQSEPELLPVFLSKLTVPLAQCLIQSDEGQIFQRVKNLITTLAKRKFQNFSSSTVALHSEEIKNSTSTVIVLVKRAQNQAIAKSLLDLVFVNTKILSKIDSFSSEIVCELIATPTVDFIVKRNSQMSGTLFMEFANRYNEKMAKVIEKVVPCLKDACQKGRRDKVLKSCVNLVRKLNPAVDVTKIENDLVQLVDFLIEKEDKDGLATALKFSHRLGSESTKEKFEKLTETDEFNEKFPKIRSVLKNLA